MGTCNVVPTSLLMRLMKWAARAGDSRSSLLWTKKGSSFRPAVLYRLEGVGNPGGCPQCDNGHVAVRPAADLPEAIRNACRKSRSKAPNDRSSIVQQVRSVLTELIGDKG